MTTPAKALQPSDTAVNYNAPSAKKRAPLTLQQEEIVRVFTTEYGLDRSQISFDEGDPDPIFDVDAIYKLSLDLTDIPHIKLEPHDIDGYNNFATAVCEVHLADGRSRQVFGSAILGEQMQGGETIVDLQQAITVAQARAMRRGMRAVGVNFVEAHNRRKAGDGLHLNLAKESDQRVKDLATAHILGKELGLIGSDGDKSRWAAQISIWFPGITSSAQMNADQLPIFIARLNALKSAQPASAMAESALAAHANAKS